MPTMRLLQVAAIFGAGALAGALALAAAQPPAR